MLQPKRLKWRRSHLVRPKTKASRCNTVAYGDYGLCATEGGYISNRQIEVFEQADFIDCSDIIIFVDMF